MHALVAAGVNHVSIDHLLAPCAQTEDGVIPLRTVPVAPVEESGRLSPISAYPDPMRDQISSKVWSKDVTRKYSRPGAGMGL
jgi:hypothetical protein